MPGYLGSSFIVDSPVDNVQLKNDVYSAIRSEAPAASYDNMTGVNVLQNGEDEHIRDWKSFISQNPQAFIQQIPYYSIKVFFVALIFVFSNLGIIAPLSVFLPNLISFFIFGFLLFSIFNKIIPEKTILSFLFTVGLLLIPQFRFLATIPSPDMLTILLMLWFFYVILDKQNFLIQCMVLLLLVFTRPDMVIFTLSYFGTVFLYDFITKKKIHWLSFVSGVTILLMYILILKINKYPGWNDVFYDTFIYRRRYLSDPAEFSFSQYRAILIDGLSSFKKISVAAFLCIASIFYFTKDLWTKLLAMFLFANLYLKFFSFLLQVNIVFFRDFYFFFSSYWLTFSLRKS